MTRTKTLIPLYKLKERKKRNLYGSGLFSLSYDNRRPKLVSSLSLKKNWPIVYDQGQIGSCTANAFCGSFKYLEKHRDFEPSRMYVYYKERLLESLGNSISDSGAFVKDAYLWVSKNGVCSEKSWPYIEENVNTSPPSICDEEAVQHKATGFYQIRLNKNLKSTIKECLGKNQPVLMAFGVYQSFMETKSDGIVQLPHPEYYYEDESDPEDPFLGGHEVAIIGYDDKKRLFEAVNSWGVSWGDNGFFYIPYSFVDNTKLVYDFSVLLGAE